MSDSDQDTKPLDDAFELLRRRRIPDGPPLELARQTVDRLNADSKQYPARPRALRKDYSMTSIKLLAGSLATAALVLIAFLMQASVGEDAFAQVQQALEGVKSVQYKETRIDGKSQRQIEAGSAIVSTVPDETVRDDGSQVSLHFISGRFQSRTEHLDRDDNLYAVNIVNMATGKLVSLNVAAKRYTLLNKQVVLHKDGTKSESDITKPNLLVDFYRQISEVPQDAVTELPAKELGGKEVVGYSVTRHHKQDTWNRTYWVDAETKLPVRVEISVSSTNPIMAPTNWVLSDFEFGKELDESLFSTDPPEGYTVVTDEDARKIYGLSGD